jgi:DNA-binding transcriptional ArsR family regulator
MRKRAAPKEEPGPAGDAGAVRALTHPLRLELLDLLRFEGPSTASRLARRVGESSGATSYHLRQLARHGFIERDPRNGGREVWWRHREQKLSLPEARGEGSDDRAAAAQLLAELLAREAHALDRYLSARGEERLAGWDDSPFFFSRALRLTPSELAELSRGVEGLVAGLRRPDAPDPPEDALPVRVLAFGFPTPRQEGA